jgi:molybdopterin-containing oxidoreductase family membrane subunit
MNVWPQWRSPLVWDLFAISTYLIVSLLFWYMGLIPDLATLRDRAKSRAKQVIYALLALGWRGEARHWARYESAYLLFAGLAAPLVISVHSVVSLDFAVANVPGYHSTIFPPFFVAGALFSGFAMVLTLAIPMRRFFGLEDFITAKHLDHAAKLMLATELIVAYSYLMEVFTAYWSGDAREIATAVHRMTGPYAPLYWTAVAFNIVMPQLLWFRRVRRSVGTLFAISLLANVGMWVERFDIVVSPLSQGYLPSASGIFIPTGWDWTMFVSSIGLFALFFLLFLRVLPAISIFEMRELAHEEGDAP